MQYKTKKEKKFQRFSPQHRTACCALMHSATYITFSQSGSHVKHRNTNYFKMQNVYIRTVDSH